MYFYFFLSHLTLVFVICLPKFDATVAADFTDPNMFNCHRVQRT